MSEFTELVSIIIPCYNEERRILPSLNSLYAFLENHFKYFEIIVVDDGSTDQTWKMITGFTSNPRVKTLRLMKNIGKGYAVKQGMLVARGEYRFFMDADLPYALGSLTKAMENFHSHSCDMVIGARDLPESGNRSGMGLIRNFGGKIFSNIVNNLLKLGIKDTQCGFKGFRKGAAMGLFSKSRLNGYAFDVEILILAKQMGLKIRKIPVILIKRNHSKIHLIPDSLKMFFDLLRLYITREKTQ
jgi:dolichyl-phosphate beta-glucosyltransferase